MGELADHCGRGRHHHVPRLASRMRKHATSWMVYHVRAPIGVHLASVRCEKDASVTWQACVYTCISRKVSSFVCGIYLRYTIQSAVFIALALL